MYPQFVFPPAYYPYPRLTITTQPSVGYSSQSILDQIPDDGLERVQRAFLSGEVLQQVEDFQSPKPFSVDLSVAICQSLSACGSLKKSPTPGSAQPNQGMAPSILPTITSPMHGRPHTLSGWMKEFPGSDEHNVALQDAIQTGPEYLASNKQGVLISDHIDFGLKHAGWTSSEEIYDSHERVLKYFRTLTIVNRNQQPVVLLDICGIPSVNHVFVLHDDYGLAHHYYPRNHQSINPKGVLLQTRSQYQITIELRCSPEDCSLHQQWLMFTFATGDVITPSQQIAGKESVVIVGRRVSAVVVKHVQDVQTCLSTETKPFYPMSLRTVFDSEPAHFSVADESTPRKYMDYICKHNSSRQIGHLSVWKTSFSELENYLEANDRAQKIGYASVLSSSVERQLNEAQIPPLSSRCPCYKRQLIQLVRLLGLEEAAMEVDVREHDLFNIKMECLDVQENRFRIEVPGLPENRPCVFKGDVVYIRWARMQHQECAALVLAVEMQPKAQIVVKLSGAFLVPLISESIYQNDTEERIRRLNLQRVLVRFMIDRLIFKNMHAAIQRTASSTAKLLPCICAGIANCNGSELAEPDSDVDSEEKRSIAGKFAPINKCLNEEQQMAVRAVLNQVDGPGPYIIFGPPGTGKTVTVVECVLQVLKTGKCPLLCVCAPSNYAADILCSGISKGGITPAHMWRLNDPRRTLNSVKADVIKFCTIMDGVFVNVHPHPSTLKVIVCTCAAAAMIHEDPTKSCIGYVTHIFIDEAGQALIPETLIPLSLARQDTCCVLCGDPRQLGPVVHSKLAAANGLAKSLLEHFMLSPQYRLDGPNSPRSARVIKLLRNYRANGKLLELPSRMFYENELIASAEEHLVAPPENWEEMTDFGFPMLFYGVKGQQRREGESPSYFNAVETTKVVDLIAGLLEKTTVTMKDIGVMAPFRRQVQKLRLVLRARKLGPIRVGTVDDYQGQEEKIIFISTVLTRPESLRRAQTAGAPEQNVGFLSNAKRFNVAITRAKAMLVVVGHPVILSADSNWQELLRYCLSRGAFRGYGSDRIPSFLRSSSTPGDPFANTDELSLEETSNDDEIDAKERKEVDDAIERIAEMSLLGLGDVERLYPETLDSFYAANSEDQEWRVVL